MEENKEIKTENMGNIQEDKQENKEKDTIIDKSDQAINQKKEKLVSSIKNFFTKEVEEEIVPTIESSETSQSQKSGKESKQLDFNQRKAQLVEFIKKDSRNLFYSLFFLIILYGYYLYKFQKTSLFFFDIFIPLPLTKFSYISFFIILPIISFILIYYKKYFYIALLYIINSGLAVRLQNLPLLRDITTNKYIPLALDPHLFLRYAKYIVEYGQLYAMDVMRYYPFGADMNRETVFLSKFIVYLYKFLNLFNSNITIEFADILYPPICFAVSLIFFFLIIKNLFNKKVALISTLILTVIPTYLYRTMAGFSDKESLGLMLMYMAFYFFIIGWKSKVFWKIILLGLFSGIATGLMGLTWGGVNFTLMLFAGFILVEILLNKFTKKDFYLSMSWVIPMIILMGFITNKFGGIYGLIKSFSASFAIFVSLIAILDFLLFKLDLLKIKEKISRKLPVGIFSIIISAILSIIGTSIIFNPAFVWMKINAVFTDMINPFGKSRWGLTVAESHQPYFTNWIGEFTWPFILLFFVGALILFYYTLKPILKKESLCVHSLVYTTIYGLFLILFTMSRYRRESPVWNGETYLSKTVYIGSFIAFVILILLSYFYLFYFDKQKYSRIKLIDKKYIFIMIWFIMMLVAARSALRLILMLAPITSILVGYSIFFLISQTKKLLENSKDKVYKITAVIFLVVILIIVFWPFASTVNAIPLINKAPFINKNGFVINYAAQSMGQARITGPSYDQQWQLAGKWMRENTSEDAVFTHWWDYGYWVQTGGERTTVTDGGNWIGYWNHLMGRHALMAQDQTEALEFLNMHNATHFLVITDEIGKIGAYSSIGSDADYDRYTWIPTFNNNPQLTKETRDGVTMIYEGIAANDEDIEWNGFKYSARVSAVKDVYIPTKSIKLTTSDGQTKTDMQILQPYTLLFQDGQQPVQVPIQCLYYQGNIIYFDEPGLDNCFMIIPTINNNGFNPNGAGLYLGHDALHSLWVNLFLFEQQNPRYSTDGFKLALSQQHPAIESINQQSGMNLGNVVSYNGRLLGPLKIWEIDYPENLTQRPEYLLKSYVHANLTDVTVI